AAWKYLVLARMEMCTTIGSNRRAGLGRAGSRYRPPAIQAQRTIRTFRHSRLMRTTSKTMQPHKQTSVINLHGSTQQRLGLAEPESISESLGIARNRSTRLRRREMAGIMSYFPITN